MLGQQVDITDEMIAVSRATILRELTHPDRDDIGPYAAGHVAKAVFGAMLAVQHRYSECRDGAIESYETIRNPIDLPCAPRLASRDLETALPIPRKDEGKTSSRTAVAEIENDPIDQAVRDAVSIKRAHPDLAEQIVERMFPRLIWIVKEELDRSLAQTTQSPSRGGMLPPESS